MSSTGQEPSIFTRIAAREVPATIVAETERIIAFTDIAPQAPVHVVITPKTSEYSNVVELAAGDPGLLTELIEVANAVAARLSNGQFRLVFNTGASVGQTVFHVHAHLLAPQAAGGTLGEGTLGFR